MITDLCNGKKIQTLETSSQQSNLQFSASSSHKSIVSRGLFEQTTINKKFTKLDGFTTSTTAIADTTSGKIKLWKHSKLFLWSSAITIVITLLQK